jgi:hypothetical protein
VLYVASMQLLLGKSRLRQKPYEFMHEPNVTEISFQFSGTVMIGLNQDLTVICFVMQVIILFCMYVTIPFHVSLHSVVIICYRFLVTRRLLLFMIERISISRDVS